MLDKKSTQTYLLLKQSVLYVFSDELFLHVTQFNVKVLEAFLIYRRVPVHVRFARGDGG